MARWIPRLFSPPGWLRSMADIESPTVDAWLCSFPKCGRTWLRFILSNYLNDVYELGADVDLHTMFQIMPNDVLDEQRGMQAFKYGRVTEMPMIVVSHTEFEPKFDGKPIVFLIRSISDALVSFYFHNSHQWSHWQGDLAEFIRHEDWGLPRMVRYLNGWSAKLDGREVCVVTYESLKHDAPREVQRIVKFLGLRSDPAAVHRAVSLASVDRMRRLEIERPLPGHQYDPQNRNASRVRKAQVGGGYEHLCAADVGFIQAYCKLELTAATWELFEQHQVPVVAARQKDAARVRRA